MSQKEFYASIDRINQVAPRLVFPAHGSPIEKLTEVTDMYRKNFQQREELIMGIIRQGESVVYKIARRLFTSLNTARLPLEIFLAVSEVYTHVQVLEDKQRIKTRLEKDRLIISPQ